MIRSAIISAGLAALLLASGPAAAMSAHDWDVASDVGAIGLRAAALGTPVVRGDWPGFWQAGGSIIIASGVTEGLKQAVRERRPDGSDYKSFPSGHTTAAFAAAATMHRRYGWEVGLPATLVATFVGLARVKADKHHWYDVVVGAAIGEASGLLITRPHDIGVRLVPWVDSTGGGVLATLEF